MPCYDFTFFNVVKTIMRQFFETMRQSLELARERNRDSKAVTYNLAVAKIALQIQIEEKPAFYYLLLHLGAFPTEIASLRALGKEIKKSGGSYILNECEELAKGRLFVRKKL